jgi:hypothetical protein
VPQNILQAPSGTIEDDINVVLTFKNSCGKAAPKTAVASDGLNIGHFILFQNSSRIFWIYGHCILLGSSQARGADFGAEFFAIAGIYGFWLVNGEIHA